MSISYRHFFIIKITLLVCTASFGQAVFVELPLLKKEINDRKFYISEIIDARSEKKILGIAINRINFNKQDIEFKKGFQPEIHHFLHDFLKPTPDYTPLVMRVLKLTLFEKPEVIGEGVVAELIVEFYQKTEAGLVLVKSSGSNFTKSGPSVKRFHDEAIEFCFLDCLNQVNEYLHNNSSKFLSKAVDYQELLKVPGILQVYDFPILKDVVLRKGIYKNFIEFRNNDPSLGHDIRKVMMGNEADKIGNVWGYSDGEKIFIQVGTLSFEVINEENIFWFEGYEIDKIKDKFTGESLLLTLFTGNLMMESTINNKLVKYCINLGNGDLFLLN